MKWEFINHPKYYYKTLEDVEFESHLLLGIKFDSKYLNINNGVATVKCGYAWNGSSPKWRFLGLMWGTPDGSEKSTLRASLIHDALYQYGKDANIKRSYADRIQLLEHSNIEFPLKYLYYYVVRLFGHKAFGTE